MLIVLLPGMDGTGTLFHEFLRLLHDGIATQVVSYPADPFLTYEQLAERTRAALPETEPYVIIAESYSGPIACLLAANSTPNLQAVVFVSSFVSAPRGRIGQWAARFIPTALFRRPMPAWLIRRLLMNGAASPLRIADVQNAIAHVSPEVLSQRLRAALTADSNAAPAVEKQAF